MKDLCLLVCSLCKEEVRLARPDEPGPLPFHVVAPESWSHTCDQDGGRLSPAVRKDSVLLSYAGPKTIARMKRELVRARTCAMIEARRMYLV